MKNAKRSILIAHGDVPALRQRTNASHATATTTHAVADLTWNYTNYPEEFPAVFVSNVDIIRLAAIVITARKAIFVTLRNQLNIARHVNLAIAILLEHLEKYATKQMANVPVRMELRDENVTDVPKDINR